MPSQTLIETSTSNKNEFVLDRDFLIGDLDWHQIIRDVITQFEKIDQQIENCDLYKNRGKLCWDDIQDKVQEYIENINQNIFRTTAEFIVVDTGDTIFKSTIEVNIPFCVKIEFDSTGEIIFYDIYGEIMNDMSLTHEDEEDLDEDELDESLLLNEFSQLHEILIRYYS